MLKHKLNIDEPSDYGSFVSPTKKYKENDDNTSKYFKKPLWKKFHEIEISLNFELNNYKYKSAGKLYRYNPLEYAAEIHRNYLEKFLNDSCELMMIGMNPGPNGMMQTGVPFGNINTVRNLMKLSGEVLQPTYTLHPKRPISGLSCTIEEPSGLRLWNLLKELSGDLHIFSQKCFVHNFCPIAFFDTQGRNITPSELKGEDKAFIRDVCLKYLLKEIDLVQPKIIISVGKYVSDSIKFLTKTHNFPHIKFLLLPHPSPRSLNNTNWAEKGANFFESNDLIKYLKNES